MNKMKITREKLTPRHIRNFIVERTKWLIKLTMGYSVGKKALNKLLTDKQDDEVYLILLMGIGDALYGLSYLDAFIDKHPGKKIIILGNERYIDLYKSYRQSAKLQFKLFPLNSKMHNVVSFLSHPIILKEAEKYDIFMSFAGGPCLDASENFLSQLRTILKVPENSAITYHGLKQAPVTVIENFEEIKHKIVIINPYSNYLSDPNLLIYENLCDELSKKGFIVFTNVIKDQKPLKGSTPLNCSLQELYSIACSIPLIVSVRSGILDLLVTSDINMFVIYEDASKTVNQEFYYRFTLAAWQCSGKIKEVLIDNQSDPASQSLIDAIPAEFNAYLDELKKEGRI